MVRLETVSIVHQHPKVLLGMKKDKFGKGKYNGFGGGIEPKETIVEAAVRETFEESDIYLIDPKLCGIILFEFEVEEQDHLVYFFKATEFGGSKRNY